MTTRDFIHRTPASRVVFGHASIAGLAGELTLLNIKRPLVLSGVRSGTSPVHPAVRSAVHAAVRTALTGLGCVWFTEVPAHSSMPIRCCCQRPLPSMPRPRKTN